MIPPSLERDFIGYGGKPPNPRWPGAAALALNFVLNYEEGSEYSMMDRDGVSDAALTELPSAARAQGDRDLAAESMFEYGSRVGFWRLHRLFHERGLPITVYACALALERNPAAAEAIRTAGYDICCHGWRWVEHYQARRSDRARAHPPRRRKPQEDGRSAAARLVLPLWAEREHAPPRDGGRRLPL